MDSHHDSSDAPKRLSRKLSHHSARPRRLLFERLLDDTQWAAEALEQLARHAGLPSSPEAARELSPAEIRASMERLQHSPASTRSQLGMYVLHASHTLLDGTPLGRYSDVAGLCRDLRELAAHLDNEWSDLLESAVEVLDAVSHQGMVESRPAWFPSIAGFHIHGLFPATSAHSTLFAATWELGQAEAVIKVLGSPRSATATSRLLREAELLGELDHQSIAPILGSGVCHHFGETRPFIATKLIEGQAFDEFIISDDYTERTKLRVFVSLCDAIHHAHRRLVAHRDLHPRNILVTPSLSPMVIDFGLGRRIENPGSELSLTVSGVPIGAVGFRSPEQSRGERTASAVAGDIYSLGALLFFLLSHQVPLKANPLLRQSRPGAARALEAITTKAMFSSPARRYDSVATLRDDIQRYLDGETVTAESRHGIRRFLRFVRAHRFSLALLSVAALLIAGLVARESTHAGRLRANDTQREGVTSVSLEALADFLSLGESLSTQTAPPTEELSRAIESARSVLAHIGEQTPSAIQSLRLSAQALELLADPLIRSGSYEEALKHQERAVELRRAALAEPESAEEDERRLSSSLVRIGDIYLNREESGDRANAERIYLEALALDRELAERTGYRGALDNLLWSHHRLAHFYRLGDWQACVSHCKSGVAVGEQLVQLHPEHVASRHARCAINTLVATISPIEASLTQEAASRALKDARWLVEQAPLSRDHQGQLLGAIHRCEAIATARAAFEDALTLATEACDVAQRLVELAPTDAVAQSRSSSAFLQLARCRSRSGSGASQTSAALELALASAKEASELDPFRPRYKYQVIRVELERMRWHTNQGQLKDGHRWGQSAIKHLDALPEAQRASAEFVIYKGDALLNGPPVLQDPEQVVQLAVTVNAALKDPSPAVLEVLAQAYAACGQEDLSAQTLEQVHALRRGAEETLSRE